MSLSAIIIDDEIKVGKTLQSIIEKNVTDINILAVTDNPVKSVGLISKFKPDLVFIDIEMPVMNGFEVLECVRDIEFKTIFVTAYDHYGIEAIKSNAFDYLLKPIKTSEVVMAIEKARRNIQIQKTNFNNSNHNDSSNLPIQNEVFKIPTLAGIDFVNASNIIRIEAAGTYCEIFCTDGNNLVMTKSISEVEKMLNANIFYRSHRSHIINIHHIKRYVYSNGGTIIMIDGKEIPLSRRKKNEFNALLNISN